MGQFKIEEAMQAREELTQRLASLGTLLVDDLKVTAKEVFDHTVDAAESRLHASIDVIDPRHFIRKRPLLSLAGAFVSGLVLVSRHRLLQRGLNHPVFAAASILAVDLLRAYALSRMSLNGEVITTQTLPKI